MSIEQDIKIDRAYRNGMIAGYNYGVREDREGLNSSVNNFTRDIHEAEKELKNVE